jgi:hypothetical protein
MYHQVWSSTVLCSAHTICLCVLYGSQNKQQLFLYAGLTRKAMYVYRNSDERWCNHCNCGKAISITYSECVSVALVIQHAKRIRRIVLSVVCVLSGCTLFFHIIINGTIFGEKKSLNINMCVLIFSATFVRNISHLRKIQRDISINVHKSPFKYPLFLLDFNKTIIFWEDFLKIHKYQT